MTTTRTARVIAEYCPGCGETHYPQKPGTAEYCRTCRYYGRDRCMPETCDECESTGYNCSLHQGWAEVEERAASAKEDAARRLVRRAYEADPDPVEFDAEAGLADVVRRANADPT